MTKDGGLDFLRILDRKDALRALQDAAITDLTARLRIERGLVEDDDAEFAFRQFFDRATVTVQRQHPAATVEALVAVETRRRSAVFERRGHPELARSARLLLLVRHRRGESGDVYADPALAADIGRQVEREAEGVMQLEGGGTVENALARHRRQFPFEDAHAVFNGFKETDFFLP